MSKDLWFAIRSMGRNPGVTALAVLTLALGIGVNSAMFSVVNALLLRQLHYPAADRLVTIVGQMPHSNIYGAQVEYNTFGEWWRSRSRSFEAMWAHVPASANLTMGSEPERLQVYRVNAGFLGLIGTRTSLGRDFLPREDQPGANRVAILSDGLWQRRFGADPGLLGRAIVLDQNSYTVVGVLPAGFDFYPRKVDMYIPIAASTARVPGEPTVGVHARLKPGVGLAAAQAEIDALCRGFARQAHYSDDWGARLWPLREYLVRDVRASVVVLAVAVALVLLIACANVANLLLARAGARQREIAIRGAMGAGRARIVQQLLTESALLGGLGAALGLLLAWAGIRALTLAPVRLPAAQPVALDAAVLWFTLGATLLTTLLFGLAPALAAVRTDLAENLKEGGRGGGEGVRRRRFRSALVVAEVALALLLTVGASLAVRSLFLLRAVDPGFTAEGVLLAQLTLPASNYPDGKRRVGFYRSLLERLNATPGVKSAGLVSHRPFGGKSGADITVEGAPVSPSGDRLIVWGRSIDPKYFQTLEVRLLHGRFFTATDPPGIPVAIVNETLARRCWPNQQALAKRFRLGRGNAGWLTVVGIISDMRQSSLAEPPDAEYYLPHAQDPAAGMAVVVRTAFDPLRFSPTLRAIVRELDQDLPVSGVTALADSIAESTGTRSFSAGLLGLFAGLALLLAAVGIYGVIWYSVTRRTHEIGVRMALGAERGAIARMVVSKALALGGAGVAIGLAGAVFLTQLLRSMLYGVSATDPLVFGGAAVFLLAVAALAGYVPARRAARVDPLVALHHE